MHVEFIRGHFEICNLNNGMNCIALTNTKLIWEGERKEIYIYIRNSLVKMDS